MEKENNVKLIEGAMTALDGIESTLRMVWPDSKPAPADKSDAEYYLYNTLTAAMVHIGDLRCDLDSVLGEV